MRSTLALVSVFCALAACGTPEEIEDLTDGEVSEAITSTTLLGIRDFQLHRIDAASGTATALGTGFLGGYSPTSGVSVISTHRLHVFGATSQFWGFHTYDTFTGAYVGGAPADPIKLERNNAGQFVGIYYTNVGARFGRVDMATGVRTILNANLAQTTASQSMSAYLPATNQYIGDVMQNGAQRLFTINATTGAVVYDVPFPSGVVTLRTNAQGQLIGTRWHPSELQIVRIIPSTGATVVLSATPGISSPQYPNSVHTLDPATNRLYQIGSDAFGSQTLYTFHASTGQLIDVSPIAGSWSGLYIAPLPTSPPLNK